MAHFSTSTATYSSFANLGMDWERLQAEAERAARDDGDLPPRTTRYGLHRTSALERLHDEGVGADIIARISRTSLHRVERHFTRREMDNQGQAVLGLHRKGLHPNAIAEELGITRQAVVGHLRRNGMNPHKQRPGLPDRTKAEIRTEKANGMTIARLAEKYGVSVDVIKNTLYPRR